jgi:hypothetical protein
MPFASWKLPQPVQTTHSNNPARIPRFIRVPQRLPGWSRAVDCARTRKHAPRISQVQGATPDPTSGCCIPWATRQSGDPCSARIVPAGRSHAPRQAVTVAYQGENDESERNGAEVRRPPPRSPLSWPVPTKLRSECYEPRSVICVPNEDDGSVPP